MEKKVRVIQKIREMLNLSRTQLAYELGVNSETIKNLESFRIDGKRYVPSRNPSLRLSYKILDFCAKNNIFCSLDMLHPRELYEPIYREKYLVTPENDINNNINDLKHDLNHDLKDEKNG